MNALFSPHIITTTSPGNLGGAEEEEFKNPKDYTEEEKAAADALDACYKYWRLYTERCCSEGNYNNAVVWLQDNQSGHTVIFTRGEHAQHLQNFVEDLSTLPRR